MPHDAILTLRNNAPNGRFGGDAAPSRHLMVPPSAREPLATHATTRTAWFDAVRDGFAVDAGGVRTGQLLVYVHGYNNTPGDVLRRHRALTRELAAAGWRGRVLSFDWPSEDSTIAYLEDRREVHGVAARLVDDLIQPFVRYRAPNCAVDVSVLAHSMGAYLVREAFLAADDNRTISQANWRVAQVVFVSADVSSSCFEPGARDAACFARHCARFTNYFTPQDAALKVSNVKRLGLAPRVGRVGMPANSSSHFVDVDCSQRFLQLDERRWRDEGGFGAFSHSWYFGDKVFSRDLGLTLLGDIDRNYLPTRLVKSDNDLMLVPRA